MAVNAIAEAISNGFKLWKTVMDSAESRKMRKAIEFGEKYIQVNERTGKFANVNDKKRTALLSYYHTKFYRYN
jgi:hypothetical protein